MQISLPKKDWETLQKLASELNISEGEVLHRAFKLYRMGLEAQSLFVVDHEGTQKEVKIK